MIMFQLSVELGGIQVAGELQAPCFVGIEKSQAVVNLESVLLSGNPVHFIKEKGICRIPVTVTTACRFCGNSPVANSLMQ